MSPPFDGFGRRAETRRVAAKKTKPTKSPRWSRPPARWETVDEGVAAASKFLTASSKLITRHKLLEDCTEVERLGMKLATRLQLAFQGVPDASYVPILREALDAFDRKPSKEKLRAWCVRAVRECGERWRDPSWQASDETRTRFLEELIRHLEVSEPVFASLRHHLPALAAKLDAWTPARAHGKKTAERILAELVVEHGPALDYAPRKGEKKRASVDRIRKLLVKEFDSFNKRATAKKA